MSKEIHNPALKSVEENGANSATLVVEPIEKGYGNTLGNSLRRVLLSSIKGAAIVAFKIDGVNHEFTTIPGVKEDVVDISLNLKTVSIKYTGDEAIEATISKKGGVVTAGDIKLTGDAEIVNPDQIIATIDDPKVTLNFNLVIESGRGYKTIEDSLASRTHSDHIAIDAIFTPVTRVRYNVEATRVGQITDLEKLNLTIDTDGSISPADAFKEANAILVNQYTALADGVAAPSAPAYGSNEEQNEEKLNKSIETLDFSARTFNALVNNEINTIRDLVSLSETELGELKGFGAKAQDEVAEKLAELEF